ncbi:Cas9 inhibitor AcrIIA9 family protein [Enterocloster bolteae]|uniref:Cas9 inhibitor AcrIIA9 family protein n=1 Tax=Enterocloster bolteae TaxID=208479 RepID=UPI0028DC62EE|nr:Cas9 inhibitor AcrIIA9 family protein [Enterocloster bolteae]
MVEKVFDKINSIHEINAIAADLRRIGLREEIKILAEKNKIPTDDVEEYLKGKRYFLVDGGNAKAYDTARGKLLDEIGFLNDPHFGDVIGQYLLKNCDEADFSALVLQNHKTLQRCIEYLMAKAQEMVTDEDGKRQRKTCVAVEEDMVYQWADEYYELDDREDVENAAQEAEETFLKRKEPKPLTGKSGKKAAKAKTTGQKKAAGPPASVMAQDTKTDPADEKKAAKEDKNQIEGQVSLF